MVTLPSESSSSLSAGWDWLPQENRRVSNEAFPPLTQDLRWTANYPGLPGLAEVVSRILQRAKRSDCEGAEYEILENATSSLPQISRISMETHSTVNRKAEDLEKLLRGYGFDVRLFDGDRLYATRLS